jgi:uncharacterized protein YjbI with pentapeptide repeats
MSDQENLLALLKNGDVFSFNQQREDVAKINFFGADLSGIDIRGANLSGVNLRKADLSNSNLSSSILYKTNLSEVDLSNTIFDNAEGDESRWEGAIIENSSFKNVSLYKANFNNSDIQDSCFDEADLSETYLKGAQLSTVSFQRAVLKNTRFTRSTISSCDFTDSTLDESKFPLCKIKQTTFANSSLEQCVFAVTEIEETAFTDTEAMEINFDKAVLDRCDFSYANLLRADFIEVQENNCSFDSAERSYAVATKGMFPLKFPKLPTHFFHERMACAIGHKKAAVTWENFEGEDTVICFALHSLEGEAPIVGTLPICAGIQISRNLVAISDGFLSICIEDRPAGFLVLLDLIKLDGSIERITNYRLRYRPSFHPRAVAVSSGVILYSIAQSSPKIRVHFFQLNGQVQHYMYDEPNAKRFIGHQSPMVLRVSGSMFEIHPRGPKKDILGIHDFPGNKSVAETRRGTTAYAWLNHPPIGVNVALGDDENPIRFHKKSLIKDVRVGFSPEDAWVFYSVASQELLTPPTLHAAQIDGIQKLEILGPNGLLNTEPEEFMCISNPNGLYLFVIDCDGQLVVFEINNDGHRLVFQFQG